MCMTISLRRIALWIGVVLCVLALPFVATILSAEVNWDSTDFIVLSSILITGIVLYELSIRKSRTTVYRIAAATGIIGALLLFWVNAGVGIIGSENQSVNLWFYAVYVVGLAGAWRSKLSPSGMPNTLFAMSVVPLLVTTIAWILVPEPSISWSPGIIGVYLVSLFFSSMFFGSGLMFRHASTRLNSPDALNDR